MSEKEKKPESVNQIMLKVVDEICDKYCKYPDMLASSDQEAEADMLEEMLYEQYCANCPLTRLC